MRFLADSGAPVERGLQRARLPCDILELRSGYVPSRGFYAFAVDMARREGVEELGFLVGRETDPDRFHPRMGELLRRSPTLYRGLLVAIEAINRTSTHRPMEVVRPPNSAYAYFCHYPSCGTQHPAVGQISWCSLMAMLGIVRAMAGPGWQPVEIGLPTSREPGPLVRDALGGVRIRLSQPAAYLALDDALLDARPPIGAPAASMSLADQVQRMEPAPGDFAGALAQLVRTYVGREKLSVDTVGEMVGISPRTLQRRLVGEGTTYRQVLDLARLDVACELLAEGDLTLTDIALRLGYAEQSVFSRAFRSWTGFAPSTYRKRRIWNASPGSSSGQEREVAHA